LHKFRGAWLNPAHAELCGAQPPEVVMTATLARALPTMGWRLTLTSQLRM
jgi:hypothetical protein